MPRFSEHFTNQRNKEANNPEPKLPAKEREAQEEMKRFQRERKTNDKFRKLLGTRQGQR